jgi:hypothetical protein
MPLLKPVKGQEVMRTATVRDFSGGWNILDDDLNLASKFSKRMYNVYTDVDGTVTVRQGTELFAAIADYFSTPGVYPVNMTYYNAVLIVVGTNGEIVRVAASGAVTRIWDAAIASTLPGTPAGWSTDITFASFAQHNGQLIVCNGVDKPLLITVSFFVDYLQDPATSSNLNVPVAKYVTTCNNYVVMAGDPVNPNRVHIASKGTSGVWFGDAAPNDGTYIDIGTVLANASTIRGISNFRGKLIIAYAEGTIIGTLGVYDASNVHIPSFDDSVEQYGAISHRSLVSYGDDMLMLDLVGVPSLKRTVFTGTIRPERISDLVDTEIAEDLSTLSFASLEDRTFAVYNQREGQFMFFIPNNDVLAATTETTCYVFTYRPSLNTAGWARFDGWNFTCGCRSVGGSVFFADTAGKIWRLGDKIDPVYSDFVGDPSNEDGVAIDFDWELPWSDVNKRLNVKMSRYLSLDTRGTAEFTAKMYVDRFITDTNGNDSPLLSVDYSAGDTGGFGGGDQPYGGGRNTANEQLWAWPAKFQFMKLRFTGSVTEQLKFVSISLQYQEGNKFR